MSEGEMSLKNDLHGKAVIVTGGTKGIGLATGLLFGAEGAHVYLTHAFGSADEDELRRAFASAGAPEPTIVQADASKDEDTRRLLGLVAEREGALEVLVSNVCVVQVAEGIESYSLRALTKSLEYSAWPFVAYVKEARALLGRYPRYVIGVSSDGPDHFYQGYEYVALSKIVMEVLCRYLGNQLAGEEIRLNIVRTRNVITESALAVHGAEYPDFVRRFGGESHIVTVEEVAGVILALASGWLDAMNGQVLNVEKGGTFGDNLMRLYRHREEFGL
jgi:NAD(P)-dependent dehydrogenase (short-subunit alcohol dehydrogenase family)